MPIGIEVFRSMSVYHFTTTLLRWKTEVNHDLLYSHHMSASFITKDSNWCLNHWLCDGMIKFERLELSSIAGNHFGWMVLWSQYESNNKSIIFTEFEVEMRESDEQIGGPPAIQLASSSKHSVQNNVNVNRSLACNKFATNESKNYENFMQFHFFNFIAAKPRHNYIHNPR